MVAQLPKTTRFSTGRIYFIFLIAQLVTKIFCCESNYYLFPSNITKNCPQTETSMSLYNGKIKDRISWNQQVHLNNQNLFKQLSFHCKVTIWYIYTTFLNTCYYQIISFKASMIISFSGGINYNNIELSQIIFFRLYSNIYDCIKKALSIYEKYILVLFN